MSFIRTLDPKLITTVVTLATTRVAVELVGVADSDPLLQTGIALVVAAVAGWLAPNTGTVLRSEQQSGNPEPPQGFDPKATQGG